MAGCSISSVATCLYNYSPLVATEAGIFVVFISLIFGYKIPKLPDVLPYLGPFDFSSPAYKKREDKD
jgi:hypothetical protein